MIDDSSDDVDILICTTERSGHTEYHANVFLNIFRI